VLITGGSLQKESGHASNIWSSLGILLQFSRQKNPSTLQAYLVWLQSSAATQSHMIRQGQIYEGVFPFTFGLFFIFIMKLLYCSYMINNTHTPTYYHWMYVSYSIDWHF